MKTIKSKYIPFFFSVLLTVLSQTAMAQVPDPDRGGGGGESVSISGPGTSIVNETKRYTVSADGGTHHYSSYSVSGGTITYNSKTRVDVKWTSVGGSRWIKVTAGVGSKTLSKTRYVNVTSGPSPPSTPPRPTVVNNCGVSTFRRANPPAGITYYWQTTSNGTSTSDANLTRDVSSSTTMYLRARRNNDGVWSTFLSFEESDYLRVPVVYSVTGGGSYCSGGSGVPIGVSDSESATTYKLYLNGTHIQSVSGNGNAISFGNKTAGGTYTVTAITNNGCSKTMSGSKYISIIPQSVAGSITSNPETRCGTGTVSLSLSGHTGTVHRWQKRYKNGNGGWYGWTTLTETNNVTNVNTSFGEWSAGRRTWEVRAVIQNSNCNIVYATDQFAVDPTTVAGTISSIDEKCGSGTESFTLFGHRGTIERWQARYKNGSNGWTGWSTITETNNLTSVNYTLNQWSGGRRTYEIRATVKSGVCGAAYPSKQVTVDPSTVAGIISSIDERCGSASVNFSLSGHTGTIDRWDYRYKDGSGAWNNWVLITGTDNQTSVTPSLNEWTGGIRTYEVRATILSGVCAPKYPKKTVFINNYPTKYTLTGGGSYCTGDQGVVVGLSDTQSGVNYQLKKNGTNHGTAVAGNGSAISFGIQTAATYTVEAINATTACSTAMTGDAVVTVKSLPAAPAAPSLNTSVPDQTTLTRATPPAGETWYWQDTPNGEETSGNRQNTSYEVYESKTVYLRSIKNGCWGPATSIAVTVTNKPFINGVTSTGVLAEGITDAAIIGGLTANDKVQSSSYMDGLGRTIQSVAWQASPTQKDVVSVASFDHRGRAQKSYLPYVSIGTTGDYRENALNATYSSSEQYQFYQTATGVAHDTQPYAEQRFETSPMSRVLESAAVGSAWDLANNKTSKADFSVFNATAHGQVKKWTINGAGLPVLDGNYADAALMVSEVVDADNHLVMTFTDKIGKTILKRVENGANDKLTYYVYNDRDQLVYIIPPKESAEIVVGTVVDQAYADTRLFHYTYDERGRVKTKETPDAGEVRFVYDQYDRVVLKQDANQRAKATPEWSFMKYDGLNRPIYTGLLATADSWETLQTAAKTNGHVTINSTGDYDASAAYPATVANDVLTESYFDKYTFPGFTAMYDTRFDSHFGTAPVADFNVHGRMTRSRTRDLTTNSWLESVTFYDEYGRAIQAQSGNHKGGTDVVTMEYDFAGRLLKAVTFYNNPQASDVTVIKTMTYDHAGRLLALDHQVNDGDPVRLVAYKYNELGQVIAKGLHGNNTMNVDPLIGQEGTTYGTDVTMSTYDGSTAIIGSNSVTLLPGFTTEGSSNDLIIRTGYTPQDLSNDVQVANFEQKVDYTYNIRGWLKAINDAQLAAENDYFGLELLYNDASAGFEQHTGMIGEVKWKGVQDAGTKSYRYSYDATSQLTGASYGIDGVYTQNTFGISNVQYDLNGNILGIQRNGDVDGVTQLVDDLGFTYAGNQLESVNDATTYMQAFNDRAEVANEYDYDANGNMVMDLNKEMSTITYNHLDRAKDVLFSDGRKVEYGYTAAGQLLWQKYYDTPGAATPSMTRDFLGGQVFENDVLVSLQTEEGRMVPLEGDPGGDAFDYQYNMKDHQGNTRLTFSTTPENYTMVETFEVNSPLEGGTGGVFQDLHPHVNANANTTPGGNEVELLQSGQTGALGLFALNKGDTVHLSVNANYEVAPSWNTFLQTGYNALFTSFDAAYGGVEGISSTANEFGDALAGAGMAGKGDANTAPRAFLNYIVFDEYMNYVNAGFQQITTAAQGIGVHENISIADILADREGYLLVYLSNENSEAVNVHFDDLTVYHGKTNIVQANDYYPFGLSSHTYSRTASLFNYYLFNESSRLEEETEWYHTPFRKYDASIGRFTAVDPLAASMASINGYHYGYNNPVNFGDPMGLRPESTRPTPFADNPTGGGGKSGLSSWLGMRQSGTFQKWGIHGSGDPMGMNPYSQGSAAYLEAQASIIDLARAGSEDALESLGATTIAENGEWTDNVTVTEKYTVKYVEGHGEAIADFEGIEIYFNSEVGGTRSWNSNPYTNPWESPVTWMKSLAYDFETGRRKYLSVFGADYGDGVKGGTGPSPSIRKISALLVQKGDKIWRWAKNGRVASKETLKRFGLEEVTTTTSRGKNIITKEFVETTSGVPNQTGPLTWKERIKQSIAILGQLFQQ